MIDVTEILTHWHAGRSINEVHESLNVDRKTIKKYITPAIEAGMAPGGPALSRAQWAVLVRDWFPGLDDTSLRQVTWPEIAVHHEYISEQLEAGVSCAWACVPIASDVDCAGGTGDGPAYVKGPVR